MVVILTSLISCFKLLSQKKDSEVGDRPLSALTSCTFCRASAENGFKVVYENDMFIAFEDRKPASQHHLLVVPKQHITSVRSLRRSDVELIRQMEEIGHHILNDHGVPKSMQRMGFHIPPFNSVNHLHLHVQGLPYLSKRSAAKYPMAPGSNGDSKGLTWFAEVHQTIQILQRGKQVGILPC